VLKKRECERERKKKGHLLGGIDRRAPPIQASYKPCRTPASLAPCYPWHGPVHASMDGTNDDDVLQCT
jgi:hypothetical protein